MKGNVRSYYTWDEIYKAYTEGDRCFAETARSLTELGRGKVTRQNVRYWINTEDFDTLGDPNFLAKQAVDKQRAQDTSRGLRKLNRELARAAVTGEDIMETVTERVTRTLSNLSIAVYDPIAKQGDGKGLTVEVLISDIQIGKETSNYNSKIAEKRMAVLGEQIVRSIHQKQELGYKIDRVLLTFLGDLIESDEKHIDSAIGCDSTTAEQMANFIEWAYKYILVPVARCTPLLDVVGIVGNHDWNGNGLRMTRPGHTQLSYPMFKSLELMCSLTIPHCIWTIPEGVFHVDNIYGSNVLYEHGVGTPATEAAMRKRKHDRAEQVGENIFYFRMADKHNICTFNNAQYVVNGAFFGGGKTGSEYSEIMGYHSQAGQWVGFHTHRTDERTTLFDQYSIQLGHII